MPNRPFSIVIICALYNEAKTVIEILSMRKIENYLDPRIGLCLYISEINPAIGLVWFGRCHKTEVNRIGTQIASVTAWEVIQKLKPNVLINLGTAGGFIAQGTSIGDVYWAQEIYYHGRHIHVAAIKDYELWRYTPPDISLNISMKVGIVSTSDSVPASELDWQRMRMLGTHAKDMEAAAIAEIADRMNVPFFALKAITDFVDIQQSTHEQFVINLENATHNLSHIFIDWLPHVQNFLNEKL